MVERGFQTGHEAFRSHIRPQVGAHRGNQSLFARIATRAGVKTVTLGHDMHVSRCRSSLIITMMYCSNVHFRLADRAIGRSTGYGRVCSVGWSFIASHFPEAYETVEACERVLPYP